MTISCFFETCTRTEDDYDFKTNGKRSVEIAIIVRKMQWHIHISRYANDAYGLLWLMHLHVIDSNERKKMKIKLKKLHANKFEQT